MKKMMVAALASAAVLAACAEKSSEITAAYVSPTLYDGLSCNQLRQEAQRVSARASQAMGVQDKKADNDAAAMAVGMILFWPALFFIKGDAETAAEVSRLKGEMEAIEQVSVAEKLRH